MIDPKTNHRSPLQRTTEVATSVAVGLFGGFSGLVVTARKSFRAKLKDFIAKKDVPTLEKEISDLKETLQDKGLPQEAVKKLNYRIQAIDARIELRTAADLHGPKLDENAMQRIEKSFDQTLAPFKEAKKYLKTTRALKKDIALIENNFVETHLGIVSKGLPGLTVGTAQRLGYLGTESLLANVTNATVATLIGFVAAKSYFNSVNVHRKLDNANDKVNKLIDDVDAQARSKENAVSR